MCGLVGVASSARLDDKAKKVFKNLLWLDTIRGPHSTGVIAVSPSFKSNVVKRAYDGPTFTSLPVYEDAVGKKVNIALLGHNRWATVGAVNSDNAHPFQHGSVTLMHNGTLIRKELLKDAGRFETDSEAVAYNMSINGVDEVSKVTGQLYGAYALVWTDSRDNSVNFVRNTERPLYMYGCSIGGKGVLAWASEQYMLAMALERNNIAFDVEEILNLRPHLHVKFSLDTGKVASTEDVDFYTPPPMPVATIQNAGSRFKGVMADTGKKLVVGQYLFVSKLEKWLKKCCKVELVDNDGNEFKGYLRTNSMTCQEFVDHMELTDHIVKVANANPKHPNMDVRVDIIGQYEYEEAYDILTYTSSVDGIDPPSDEDDTDGNVEYLEGPHGLVTRERYEDLVACGCGNCGSPFTGGTVATSWYGEEPICDDCVPFVFPQADVKF